MDILYGFPFVGQNRISSAFGLRTLNDKSDYHKGLDIIGDDDTHVHAVVGGIVKSSTIVTNHSDLTWQWGNYVKIHGDDGLDWFYCHLSSRAVKVGQRVDTGDIIGIMGNTGYSFGAHTHVEVRNSAKTSLNPCEYLGIPNVAGVSYNTILIDGKVIVELLCIEANYRWRTGVGTDSSLYYDKNNSVSHCLKGIRYRIYDIRKDSSNILWAQITPPKTCTLNNPPELWVSSECFDWPVNVPQPEEPTPPMDILDWDSSCNEFVVSATGADRKRLRALCEELGLPVRNLK